MNRVAALAALLLFAACTSEPMPTVVVYLPAEFEESFRERIADGEFQVEVVAGDIAELTTAIIHKQDSPPADVLITSSVIHIWRAGDQGALRPLRAAALQSVPAELRDPDGTWAALGHQPLLIGMMPGAAAVEISSFADLGAAKFADQLCMTSSTLPSNQVLVAMLIEDLGAKSAERIVRAWVRNLASPPFGTEAELAEALSSGRCRLALISGSTDVDGLVRRAPPPTYFDIHGIGVARHSRQPDAAHELVERLLATAPRAEPVAPGGRNVGLAAWRVEEVRRLNERAGYR